MADEPEEGEETPQGPTALTSRKSSPEEPYRPGEMEIVEWVEGLKTDAEEAKRDLCDPETWPDDEDAYWGDQWPSQMPSYKPRIVVNEIKSLLLQELSDLTDSRLKIFVQKRRGFLDRDQAVEDTIQTFWTRNFCDLTMLFAALDAMIYPLGFIQTGWLPMAQQGQGEVLFTYRDPLTVFPDGDATNDDELRYMVLEDVLDILQIRRDWPEHGWKVQPDGNYSIKAEDRRPGPRAGSQYTGPLYAQTRMTGVPGYKKARAGVLTCVVDDDDLVEEINEVAGELRQVQVPKYPHRRLIIVANRRVLYDDDCPFHYAPMLTRVMLQPAIHSYWPRRSIVNEFGEIQATANKMDSMTAENMLRMNLGEVFADADSGLNPKTYGGVPGAVYLVKPGSRVQKTYPNPMPREMVEGGEMFRGFIRTRMGYPAARAGVGTQGNVAAELVETEISQAMGLTRLKGRLLYVATQKAVEMLFARMAQFYTTPRHVPYIDQGELRAIQWQPVAKPEEYVTHVDSSSFQIRSKTMMQRIFFALARMNKIPTGRLLKMLEISDADTITAELKEELVLQAAANQARRARGRR